MAVIDRIKYDGSLNKAQWLIYKCPSEKFVLGSQLVVNQGQEALFFKGGKALDLFGPGTHTLSTGNLPLFNKLVNLPFGNKTPFSAEIYYINKTVNLDLKWGTSIPIPLEDPKYGLILNIGAHGQYGITIYDSRLFVSRIIGAIPNGIHTDQMIIKKYFNGLINSKIKSVTAKYMIRKKISFLEISQFLSELSDLFKAALEDEFERFGVEIVNFYCEAIAPKPKEYKRLCEYKEELLSGIVCSSCGAKNSLSNKFCSGCGKGLTSSTVCSSCGAQIPAGMKFCGECGKEIILSIVCPDCGFENGGTMKYCGNCGQKL